MVFLFIIINLSITFFSKQEIEVKWRPHVHLWTDKIQINLTNSANRDDDGAWTLNMYLLRQLGREKDTHFYFILSHNKTVLTKNLW